MSWKSWMSGVVFAVLVSGCGGGGGSTPVPDKVTVDTDADALAYYDTGDDSWKRFTGASEDLGGGISRYELDLHGDYDLALRCENEQATFLFSLNTRSDKYVQIKCSEQRQSATVYGSISSQVSGASPLGYAIAWGTDYTIIESASDDYKLSTETNGSLDLLAALFENTQNGIEPTRFWMKRGFEPLSTQTYDIVFDDDNSVPVEGKSFTVTSGNKAAIYLISANDTYFESNLSDRWYYPVSGLTDQDIYLIKALDEVKKVTRIWTYPADKMPREDITDVAAGDIEALSSVVYSDTGEVQLSGMSVYLPHTATCQKMRGFLFELQNGNGDRYYVMLSADRLVDPFTLPAALNSVDGFTTEWDGSGANEVHATAVMSDVSFSTMMKAGRFTRLSDVDIFLVNDAIIELAEQQVK